MNMKLLSGLAVAIALISAMTFVGVYAANQDAPEGSTNVETPGTSSTGQQKPSGDTTTGSADVQASVEVGGDDVQASVIVQ